ncbi:vang-like protein 1 [Copidosoma floridanum]|uniref:vang-like protein 1 n=1 Tax=Copidosoma floridanum TaxID=29053 RepID=UPI0006C94B9D|nr:vang-like protein 1 [Copidosoma floridanum]XP_014211617.1 vang-like protein 1 [Copidosoma floridanum]
MAPFQTMVNIREEATDSNAQDIIDVQILPDEETWAENTTIFTGNTSERSDSVEGIDQWSNDEVSSKVAFIRYVSPPLLTFVIFGVILSPLIMIITPKLGMNPDSLSLLSIQQKLVFSSCNIECKGHLLGLMFKVTLLGIGNWAIFFRAKKVFTPRLCIFQTGVVILTMLCVSTYWLFFIVQIVEGVKSAVIGDLPEYKYLVNYADSLANTLLFIHYIAVLLIEIHPLKSSYYLKVIRSPDGESHSFAIGQLSIQQAAVWILENYYTKFSIYNPYLERLPASKSNKTKNHNNFKFYNVDSNTASSHEEYSQPAYGSSQAVQTAQAKRRDSSHNERFYEEHDYDRRVRKRKARLITATEEAFAHIQRVNSDIMSHSNSLNPLEAAQSVFPSMARALQKYLRITRQQPRYTVETILKRLAHCISQDLSPRSFLEPFFNTSPVLSNEKEQQRKIQEWALVCEGDLPSRPLRHNSVFQLRQGEIALLCTIYSLPNLSLTEQIALPKSNRFLLRLNSETSV